MDYNTDKKTYKEKSLRPVVGKTDDADLRRLL